MYNKFNPRRVDMLLKKEKKSPHQSPKQQKQTIII